MHFENGVLQFSDQSPVSAIKIQLSLTMLNIYLYKL